MQLDVLALVECAQVTRSTATIYEITFILNSKEAKD